MRHTRSSSGASGGSYHQQRNTRQGHQAGQRTYQALDSPPPRHKHRSGPAMSAERFLLIVDQLMSRANHLWQQEEFELQRGHELMVICPSPPSPQHPMPQHEVDDEVASPPSYPYDTASLLHPPPSHCLQSPSLVPVTNHLSSPTWSADLLAASFGLGQQAPDGVEETAAVGPSCFDSAPTGCGQGSREPPHGQQLSLTHHHQQQQHNGWQMYDAEAYITLQPAGAPLHGGGVGGSGVAKTRLLDKFDSHGGAGTATARQAQNLDPFYGLLSYTPGADDFLGSPSWGPGLL